VKNKTIISIIISGIFYVLSFPPFEYQSFVYLSLIILFYTLFNSTRNDAMKISIMFGLVIYTFGASWIFHSIYFFGGENIFISLFVTITFIILQSSYFILYGYFVNHDLLIKGSFFYLLLPPSIWVFIEFIRSNLFGGFPWLLVGMSQIHTIYDNIFPIGGTYVVTFIIILLSNFISILFMKGFTKKNITVLVTFFSLLVVQINMDSSWTTKSEKEVSLSIIQPNINQNIKFSEEELTNLKNKYINMAANTASDLIILPETALPYVYNPNKDFFESNILKYTKNLVTGIFRIDTNKNIYNSILLLGDTRKYYDKRHLVPFGEFTPFKSIFSPLSSLLNIPMSDLTQGSRHQNGFDLDKYFISTIICYESGFPSLISIPDDKFSVILTVSNDSWFGNTFAPYQHLQITKVRALENQRHFIRAANTGISAHINERGKIIKKLMLNSEGTIESHFSTFKGKTPYSRFGDYPILMLIFIIIILYLIKYWAYGKRV